MAKDAAAVVETDDEIEGSDLDSALEEALSGLGKSEETTETVETETVETVDTEGRERNPDGTFKAKAGEEVEEVELTDEQKAEQEAAEKKAAEEAAKAEPQIVDGKDITKPPTTWQPEAAAEFAKLPESVRKQIYKREEDIHRGIEQYKGAANFGVEIAKVTQPYRQMLEATKLTPSDLMSAACQFEYAMRTGTPEQKLEVLQNLAKAYGLTQPEVDAEGKPIEPDPKFSALETKIQSLEGKLTARERADQEAQQRATESVVQEVKSEIAAFAADPKNEFYGLVKDDMLQLIKSGQGADLRDAYDKAIWINPVTREKLLARQQETERKSAAEKAAAARKANLANVTPRATPHGKTSGKGTLDDALNAALDQALG